MIVAGITGTVTVLDQLQEAFDTLTIFTLAMTVEVTAGILALLTAFGGLGVAFGGVVLTTRRVEIGRLLILIFVGMGVLSLIMSLAQTLSTGTLMMDLGIQFAQSLGWIGAIFAVISRIIAEQKPLGEISMEE